MTNPQHISLRTLSRLPHPRRLRELAIANATLDALLMPDWELRYFSYDSRWGSGEEMASLRDGSGSHHYLLFSRSGTFLKGFDVGSPRNALPEGWATRDLPTVMGPCLDEAAFEMSDLTYCAWYLDGGDAWGHGVPGRADLLDARLGHLQLLLDDPAPYADWATEYYERNVPLESVRWVRAGKPLNEEVVASLNDGLSLRDLSDELEEIGYPARS